MCACLGSGGFLAIGRALDYFFALRRTWSGSYPGRPYILDRYSSGEQTSLLCTDVRLESEWEYRIRVSHMHHPVEFRHFRSAATCYGMRQSSVYSLRVEDWIMLLFGWFFPLPCLRAPGRGVPGFLAGPALVFCCCFSSMIQTLSFVIFTRMSHVSQCTSRIMYRFFTSHQPMMNEQDQVTWTNWPASKKNSKTVSCFDVFRRPQTRPSNCQVFTSRWKATAKHYAKKPFSMQWNPHPCKLVQQMPGRLEHHAKNPFSMQSTVGASEKLSISLRTAA